MTERINHPEENGAAMSRSTGRLGALLVLAATAFACAAGSPPRWRYDAEGKPVQYKRYPRHIAVDYFTRFRRTAYVKVEQPLERLLSDEQRRWISDNGQPDYCRRPFRSRLGERVEEWVYLTKNKLVQFVRGRVVFEGDVTDLEQTMIRYGYPRGAIIGQAEPGVERFTFVYGRPFDLEREVFSFADGKLLFSQTQR